MNKTLTNDAAFCFHVHDVEPADRRLADRRMYETMKEFVGGDIESCSDYHQNVLSQIHYHPLLAAVYTAFSRHYPLVLSPDAVWITITQGVAHHLMVHGERLRDRFVAHQGQRTLQLKVQDWVEGSPENLWADAFEAWADGIREHVGDEIHAALRCDFSTTTAVERAASHIVMMDVFQRYFKYELYAVCGIPSITLTGSEDDWQRLRNKVEGLVKFDLDWWLGDLRLICDQFRARRDDVDVSHWRNICKLEDAYGGSLINGWIARLFPYLLAFTGGPCTRRNPIFETGDGFQTFAAPSGLSRVPFKWINAVSGQIRLMEAIGGLTGIVQDPQTNALRPKAGWVVRRALPLDHLMHRLSYEQTIVAPETKAQSMYDDGADNERVEPIASAFPPDLGRLCFETRGARIVSGNQAIEIVDRQQVESVDWGEEEERIENSRGPDGRTWYRFANLDDGRFLLINLDMNCHDHRPDKQRKRPFSPICVSNLTTVGHAGRNPLVAFSFHEWLEKCLDWSQSASQNTGDVAAFYWDANDFAAFGDAEEFTRR